MNWMKSLLPLGSAVAELLLEGSGDMVAPRMASAVLFSRGMVLLCCSRKTQPWPGETLRFRELRTRTQQGRRLPFEPHRFFPFYTPVTPAGAGWTGDEWAEAARLRDRACLGDKHRCSLTFRPSFPSRVRKRAPESSLSAHNLAGVASSGPLLHQVVLTWTPVRDSVIISSHAIGEPRVCPERTTAGICGVHDPDLLVTAL